MKKIRDNWWNRIFHKKALKEYKAYRKQCSRIIGWYPQLLQDLKEAKDLSTLLSIHKHAWEIGYQNKNLAPCEWGMFRTNDIPNMTPSEVYLGGMYTGLNTYNIPYWESHKTETWECNGYGHNSEDLLYDTIMKQYRDHLKSNFRAINDESANQLFSSSSKYEIQRKRSH